MTSIEGVYIKRKQTKRATYSNLVAFEYQIEPYL